MKVHFSTYLRICFYCFLICYFNDSCKKDSNNSNSENSSETVTDIDGNIYHTIKIGSQIWLVENLQVVHYRNGDPVLNVTGDSNWITCDTGAYCNYDNNLSYVKSYGRLYNWFAVNDPRILSPLGWHIPTDNEWKQLEIYLGLTQEQADGHGYRGTIEGGKLKEAGTEHWIYPNSGASNSYGFTGLPGGYRTSEFKILSVEGLWWTSSKTDYDEGIFRGLSCNDARIGRGYYFQDKTLGLSVRCVKD